MEDRLYQSIIEKASIGYAYHELVFDDNNNPCDYIFLEVNKAFETLTGLKAVDIIGKRITQIFPNIRKGEFDWITFYGNIVQNNLQKEFKQFSQPLKKDYWVNAFSPEKNHFVTLFSFPQENTADFKKLFENMPIGGVIYKVINDGMLGTDYIGLDFNNQSCLLESKTREEMIGKTSYDLRPSLDSYGLIDVFREVWKTGVSQKFPTKMYIDEKFSNYYDIDVFRLSEDEIVAMVKDVTEIMQNQEELKEKTHKLATYIDKAPYGIFIADQNGYYLEANAEACTITGYSSEELIGKNLLDLTIKEHREIAKESFGEMKKSGFTEDNLKFLTKNGQIRWWNTRAVKLNENSYLGFAIDITDKKLLEEKNINMQMMLQNQQKLEAIGTLASGVAHEINNPINGIMNYSQLIADSAEEDSEAKMYANEIIAEAKRIAGIVQSLLQFSRQENASFSLADIQDIVNSTLTLVNSIIKEGLIKAIYLIINFSICHIVPYIAQYHPITDRLLGDSALFSHKRAWLSCD